jgi:hypothetical protein
MNELNIIMKKFLIQIQHLNAILNDTEHYIEYCLKNDDKLIEILDLLQYINAKTEITLLCIEEIKLNKANGYLEKIYKENELAIKDFKKNFHSIVD